VTANYKIQFDHRTLRLVAAGLWITENSSASNSYLTGFQAMLTHDFINQEGNVTFGASYFLYSNVKGVPAFYYSIDGKGNSVTPGSSNYLRHYMTDFRLVDGFTEINFKMGKTPFTIIGNYVHNIAADSLNNGWLAGLCIGKINEPGSWAFRYNYRSLEADAVVGAFTNSDFGGGGTDAKGHEAGGSYQFSPNSTIAITYFNNQIGLKSASKTDYQKWQVDLKFKF
ncbi:MAG: hypothetical protein GY865_00765, partial [candidate division Zixibacteria bacterium]|nr:hypothetical protein [candidate division Zixibacteria bacterium]